MVPFLPNDQTPNPMVHNSVSPLHQSKSLIKIPHHSVPTIPHAKYVVVTTIKRWIAIIAWTFLSKVRILLHRLMPWQPILMLHKMISRGLLLPLTSRQTPANNPYHLQQLTNIQVKIDRDKEQIEIRNKFKSL